MAAPTYRDVEHAYDFLSTRPVRTPEEFQRFVRHAALASSLPFQAMDRAPLLALAFLMAYAVVPASYPCPVCARKEGRKVGRKGGRMEGSKGGRKEGRKEGKRERLCELTLFCFPRELRVIVTISARHMAWNVSCIEK